MVDRVNNLPYLSFSKVSTLDGHPTENFCGIKYPVRICRSSRLSQQDQKGSPMRMCIDRVPQAGWVLIVTLFLL